MYSKSIDELIKSFRKLPSVGQKTAERFVFYLLKSGKNDVIELGKALHNLIDSIKSCNSCWDFTDSDPCYICRNTKRDRSILCIVAEPPDIQVLEKTDKYTGLYFVLRGLIDIDRMNLKYTKISNLFSQVKLRAELKEIIIALNPNMEGETTSLYIISEIQKLRPDIKISRLARGLPMGSDLQYADEITLGEALKNRTSSN